MPQNKIPNWIRGGAGVLAFSAGCINSNALIGATHLAVSNVTGNVTLLSTSLVEGDFEQVWVVLVIIFSFLMGAILSGLLVRQEPLKLGKRYGYALTIEALLLSIAIIAYSHAWLIGAMATTAMACGLQNAMISTYSGAVIRTTHLTGLMSDMGAGLGNWLAGREVNRTTIMFQSFIWTCYCGGGIIGAWLFLHFNYLALLLPTGIVTLLAVLYGYLSYQQEKQGNFPD